MKIAVVGSGVSGLGATWLLNEHSEHEVHLYEADSRPGGHANTVRFVPPGREPEEGVDVDTGFIVFNPSTYPNFIAFLNQHPKDVQILPTEMTFSVSRDYGTFEWAGKDLTTIFCQPTRFLDPDMWRLIYDVLRFNSAARKLVLKWNTAATRDDSQWDDYSIGDYLDRERYSQSFKDNYLIPMTACIWSTPPDTCTLDFPARTLIQFFNNHHLLQITGKPDWLTLDGGSKTYVNKILQSLDPSRLHLSTPVKSLSTSSETGGVELETASGGKTRYDHVILACHSDTALSMLNAGQGITESEKEILGSFKWSKNEAFLHSDTALMPKSRRAWACWNFLTTSVLDKNRKRKANGDDVSLTYGMNDLQHISEDKYGPVLVTLNPLHPPEADKLAGSYRYDHPVLNAQSVRAQSLMPTIQGKRHISFAGAWLKYGFHEDGFTSGLRAVVDHIPNVHPPFEVRTDHDAPRGDLGAVFVSLLALAFDLFENLGLRAFWGFWLAIWLGVGRWYISWLVDLSHIRVVGDRKDDGSKDE